MVNIANARLSFNHLILVTFALLLLTVSGSTWARMVRVRPVWFGEETTLRNQDLDFGFSNEEATTLELGEIEKEESSQSQNSSLSLSLSLSRCLKPGSVCIESRNCCGDYYCEVILLPTPRCVRKNNAQFVAAN